MKKMSKKIAKKIMAMLLVGMCLSGCEESPNDDKPVHVDIGGEEETKNPSEENTPNEDHTGIDKQEKATPTPTQKPSEVEIQLPDEKENILYTSLDELQLEPASHIAVVVKSLDIGYWEAVQKGMQQAVDDLNEKMGYTGDDKVYMTYEGPKTENSVDQQVNILDAVVSENPDVICLAAIDMNSCMAQIEAAGQNAIPVIILDSGLEADELVYSNCSTDNYQAGREAARRLCESIGDEGQVAALAHLQLSETSVSRINGFCDELKENHPNVELVNISYEDAQDSVLLKEQMEAVLTLYPQLCGYFCTNQVVSETALAVLEQDKYENREISLVGFDMGKMQMEAIREGKETGTICQNPYGMGYAAVVAGVRAAMGLENELFIDTGFCWLDRENMDLEENQKYLYE